MHVSATDARILTILQSEGRISGSELASRIGMSESSCLRRMRSLEESGVIVGYRAVVDQRQLGFSASAYILVSTNQRTETDRKEFLSAIVGIPQIISCAAVTGSHDFILEAVLRDIEDLSNLTLQKILELPSVTSICTLIAHKWIKRGTPLPV